MNSLDSLVTSAQGVVGLLPPVVGLYLRVREIRRDVSQDVDDNHDAARGSRRPKKRQAKRRQTHSSNILGRLISTMLLVVGGMLILWAIYGGTLM
jgi:hypothetical protein